ncbi:MAG: right-handed parallel beta-helix repeat-containing protein [Ktedonobacteraceae bacterium]
MKKALSILAVSIPLIALIAAISVGFVFLRGASATSGNSCTPTGFFRDNINLTAAVIPANNTPVTGSVNASGCNIGVYYGPGIKGTVTAQVFGANYYGIVNNGGNVTITRSQIHDIGENPLNGDQHGVSIYFAYGAASAGSITSNMMWNYQKGGIVVNGTSGTVAVTSNTVIGQGPVSYIAQNGIQIGYGAKATVTKNIVVGNSYTGAGQAASGGILVVGGSCYGGPLTIGTKITGNTVIGNDIGVYLSNLDGNTCIPTDTPTNIKANANIITNDAINNTTGAGTAGYQAGISDQGDYDTMNNNSICGLGYTYVTPPPYLYAIDITVTNNPTVTNNTSCLDGSPITPPASGFAPHIKQPAKASSIR